MEFSLIFDGDTVIIGDKSLPIGRMTTELFNFPDENIMELLNISSKTKEWDKFLDILGELPFISLANPDFKSKDYSPKWYIQFADDLMRLFDGLREIVDHFTADVIVRANCNMPQTFQSTTSVLRESLVAAGISFCAFTGTNEDDFEVKLKFEPIPDPANPEEYTMIEKTIFTRIFDLIWVDFYRCLRNGHIPCRCVNCDRWFLLDKGYRTLYCESIAPNGNGKQTCRQVGAKIAEKEKIAASPVHTLYNRVYKKFDARKRRRKISADEYNASITKALELRDKAFNGEVSVDKLRKIYKEM